MSDKKIAQWMRLKDKHPVMVKLLKLYDYAEKLGIHISFDHNGAIVEDTDWKGPMLRMHDIEEGTNDGVTEWPPATEFKIIYENPEYVAEQKRQYDERKAREEAEATERSRKAKEAAKARAEAARIEVETREREQLARLKEKYPEP